MARLVQDTNVLVSAYAFGGRPAELVRRAITAELELETSPALLAERARVLADKLEFDATHVESAIKQVARIAGVVRATQRISVLDDDPDNRVLECAIEGHADWIVSGDRHPLGLCEYVGVRISPGCLSDVSRGRAARPDPAAGATAPNRAAPPPDLQRSTT